MTGLGAGLAGGIAAAVLIVVSCGSDVQTTSSASGTTAGGGATTSSTQGPASTSSGGSCDPGYSAGCCFGDGYCCPCVGFYCAPDADHAAIEAFQQCACAAGVCATECQLACQGGGIDGACFVCASKVAQTTCAAEFAGCSGTLPFACPPATCEACEACSSWS